MPSMLMLADTQFPRFTEAEGNDEKFDKVYNYLYMLLEQLRYTLTNLGSENFNTSDLGEIGEVITAPLSDELQVFRRVLVGENGDMSQISQSGEAIISQIASVKGDISTLTQTSVSLTSRIADAEGAITEIKQTGSSLSLSVSNNGTSSTISLYSNGTYIDSATVNITGVLTVSHLTDGKTVISGANIQTGVIEAIGISTCDIVGGTIVGGEIFSSDIHGSNITLYYRSSEYGSTSINFDYGVDVGSIYMFTASTAGTPVGIMLETYNSAALKLYSSGNLSIEAEGLIYLMAPDGTAWHFKNDGIYHGGTKVVSG